MGQRFKRVPAEMRRSDQPIQAIFKHFHRGPNRTHPGGDTAAKDGGREDDGTSARKNGKSVQSWYKGGTTFVWLNQNGTTNAAKPPGKKFPLVAENWGGAAAHQPAGARHGFLGPGLIRGSWGAPRRKAGTTRQGGGAKAGGWD